ncbi:hypothetical protein PIB30_069403, partial [Stylosanthes scabra]|nr:hypothetical protein [Stylosanthes scabra]
MLEKLTVAIGAEVMINEEMLEVTKLERREYAGKSCRRWPEKLKSSEVAKKGNEEVAEWKQMAEKVIGDSKSCIYRLRRKKTK